MKMTKLYAAAFALFTAVGANADAVINTPDGLRNFGGFDWASNGSILIDSYNIQSGTGLLAGFSDTFTLQYQAYASSIYDKNGVTQLTPNLRLGTGSGYEYTINAQITEVVTCIVNGCSLVSITPQMGSYTIKYQAVGNANAAGISGILDGTTLLSGILTGGSTVFSAQGPSNPGNASLSATLFGTNQYTNAAFINPALGATNVVSTLQFGTSTTAWTRPNSFDGVGVIGPDTSVRYIGQADANQAFAVAAVPEPGALALVGLALGIAGVVTRKRKPA